MRLAVSHRTTYRFDAPVRGIVQSHRLRPADCANQRVLSWTVSVEGGVFGAGLRDGAGDWIETMTLRSAVEELSVEVAGQVETSDLHGVLKNHREIVRPAVYLRETRATQTSIGLEQLAVDALAKADTPLGRAHALSQAVSERVEYRPGGTDARTTAAEALELGYGVCQDHAQVLVAAAIRAAIPARYVSGYLYSEAGDAMAEASHAWAELFVDGLGWIGFDAANECCPDERYIRLGSGFDALDAAPIRGITHGLASESLDVAVSVDQVQQ